MNFADDRYQRALSLILELGYLCAFSGSTRDQAIALLTAHKAARPESRGHLVGEAIIRLCCDAEPEEAVSVIRQAGFDYREANEEPLVTAFWAFILTQAGYNSEASGVINYLLDNSDDTEALQLARSVQQEMLG